MSDQIDYSATRNYLNSLRDKGVRYGLDSIRSIASKLSHPEKKSPCIHVAGTNGKGSTCAMIEAIYRANGYQVGLYTSPQLIHEGELIQVNRSKLSETNIILYVKQLKPIAAVIGAEVPDGHPSFFELMTMMAFLHFAKSKVDLAIIETGLGGRLDATNIVEPELSIITSISLDHTEILGDTIDKIAREKAGIIKPGRPVLISKLPEAAESVIRRIASENGSKLYSVCERFPEIEKLPGTNLAGTHQRWNAAAATYATEILKKKFPIDSMRTAPILQSVEWPGRWQTLKLDNKTLILEAAHNPEGVEMLKQNLEDLVQENQFKPVIIVGTTGELRAKSLMPVVAHYACKLHLVTPQQPNATPIDSLETYLPAESRPIVSKTNVKALFPAPGICTAGKPGDTIIVTGSIYLIGEVLKQLNSTTAS